MTNKLLFLAGQRAYRRIRAEGLSCDDVEMVVGASGAAKWLTLHGLESAIFTEWMRGRSRPLHLYGTSIGAWKSAAASRRDAKEGFNRLAEAYIHQYYERKITREQVAGETERIMGEFLGPGVPQEVLSHPTFRLHFSAVRCIGPLASDNPKIELAGLVAGWIINRISRDIFRKICQPTLFYNEADPPPFLNGQEFSGGKVGLGNHNFRQALLASGSIPYVMESVKNIPGAMPGAYRDGGLFHYHPAFDFLGEKQGIVLYPHFYDQAILGWLDKGRPARIADGKRLADVLMLSPSPEFIRTLPFGRISDRKDFERLAGRDDERVAAWSKCVQRSAELGQEFMEVVESGAIRDRIRLIP